MPLPHNFSHHSAAWVAVWVRFRRRHIALRRRGKIMASSTKADTIMPKNTVTVTPALIRKYSAHLHEQDHSSVTIEKYVHDLTALSGFLAGQPMTKGLLLEWRENRRT